MGRRHRCGGVAHGLKRNVSDSHLFPHNDDGWELFKPCDLCSLNPAALCHDRRVLLRHSRAQDAWLGTG